MLLLPDLAAQISVMLIVLAIFSLKIATKTKGVVQKPFRVNETDQWKCVVNQRK